MRGVNAVTCADHVRTPVRSVTDMLMNYKRTTNHEHEGQEVSYLSARQLTTGRPN